MNKRREAGGSRWARWARGWWRPWAWFRRAAPSGFAPSPQQMEMILGAVKPVRNPLMDDDVEVLGRRQGGGRLLHETRGTGDARQSWMRAESDRTYERLRGRRLEGMRVGTE